MRCSFVVMSLNFEKDTNTYFTYLFNDFMVMIAGELSMSTTSINKLLLHALMLFFVEIISHLIPSSEKYKMRPACYGWWAGHIVQDHPSIYLGR